MNTPRLKAWLTLTGIALTAAASTFAIIYTTTKANQDQITRVREDVNKTVVSGSDREFARQEARIDSMESRLAYLEGTLNIGRNPRPREMDDQGGITMDLGGVKYHLVQPRVARKPIRHVPVLEETTK